MTVHIYHQQPKHNELKFSCVFYVRVDTICYIVFHPVRTARKFYFQPFKLNVRQAVAVREAIRFLRKASVPIRQPM